MGAMDRFLFPRWVNRFVLLLLGFLAAGGLYAGAMGGLITDPETLNIGYQPEQPIPFSHALHAGQLKMDCRYCHNTVYEASHAAVPPTSTCINCHSPYESGNQDPALAAIKPGSRALAPLHESWQTGRSIAWKRVHNLPDFVYFNHAAHVNSGVSCVFCHGRVDKMEVVHQDKQLSMAWCLECHRNPTPNLRPVDKVTQLDWKPEDDPDFNAVAHAESLNINPQTHCAVCHR